MLGISVRLFRSETFRPLGYFLHRENVTVRTYSARTYASCAVLQQVFERISLIDFSKSRFPYEAIANSARNLANFRNIKTQPQDFEPLSLYLFFNHTLTGPQNDRREDIYAQVCKQRIWQKETRSMEFQCVTAGEGRKLCNSGHSKILLPRYLKHGNFKFIQLAKFAKRTKGLTLGAVVEESRAVPAEDLLTQGEILLSVAILVVPIFTIVYNSAILTLVVIIWFT